MCFTNTWHYVSPYEGTWLTTRHHQFTLFSLCMTCMVSCFQKAFNRNLEQLIANIVLIMHICINLNHRDVYLKCVLVEKLSQNDGIFWPASTSDSVQSTSFGKGDWMVEGINMTSADAPSDHLIPLMCKGIYWRYGVLLLDCYVTFVVNVVYGDRLTCFYFSNCRPLHVWWYHKKTRFRGSYYQHV